MFDERIAMTFSPVFRRNGHACQLITAVAFLEQCADSDNVRITRKAENISPVGNDRFRMLSKFSIGRFQREVLGYPYFIQADKILEMRFLIDLDTQVFSL